MAKKKESVSLKSWAQVATAAAASAAECCRIRYQEDGQDGDDGLEYEELCGMFIVDITKTMCWHIFLKTFLSTETM